ncbi:ABC transporter permease [Cryptosporangium sp. NPDC048952]|uniref:ABC transporter permease n=1 Tax=Cryptosporangium sp. NPDC048952 TaxID=3363961 RepID=UPI003713E7D6
MNPLVNAVRAGLSRGLIELRQTLTTPIDLWNHLLPSLIYLVVLYFTRGDTVPGTTFSLGARTLPSLVGMTVAFSGLTTMMMSLAVEREDGTLLRAKAVPNGMLGYLVGKVTLVSSMIVINVAIILVPGLFLLDGLAIGSVSGWLTLAWVLVLGLIATLPLGAILGSLIDNPRNGGLAILPAMALVAISGIFYPLDGYPDWLADLGRLFPVYWLGLGMRSALLPDSMAAVEHTGSWQHLATFGALSAWAIVGLCAAPIVLRRMARRESGSAVIARRDRALQRAA